MDDHVHCDVPAVILVHGVDILHIHIVRLGTAAPMTDNVHIAGCTTVLDGNLTRANDEAKAIQQAAVCNHCLTVQDHLTIAAGNVLLTGGGPAGHRVQQHRTLNSQGDTFANNQGPVQGRNAVGIGRIVVEVQLTLILLVVSVIVILTGNQQQHISRHCQILGNCHIPSQPDGFAGLGIGKSQCQGTVSHSVDGGLVIQGILRCIGGAFGDGLGQVLIPTGKVIPGMDILCPGRIGHIQGLTIQIGLPDLPSCHIPDHIIAVPIIVQFQHQTAICGNHTARGAQGCIDMEAGEALLLGLGQGIRRTGEVFRQHQHIAAVQGLLIVLHSVRRITGSLPSGGQRLVCCDGHFGAVEHLIVSIEPAQEIVALPGRNRQFCVSSVVGNSDFCYIAFAAVQCQGHLVGVRCPLSHQGMLPGGLHQGFRGHSHTIQSPAQEGIAGTVDRRQIAVGTVKNHRHILYRRSSRIVGIEVNRVVIGSKGTVNLHIVGRHQHSSLVPTGEGVARLGGFLFNDDYLAIGQQEGLIHLSIHQIGQGIFVDCPLGGDRHITCRHGIRDLHIPSGKGVTLSGGIGGHRNGGTIHILDGFHRRTACGIEGDGIDVDLPQGGDGHITCGHGCGNLRAPSQEGVTLSGGIRRSGHRRAIILVQDDIRLAVALDKGDDIAVNRPLRCDHQILRRHGARDCLVPAGEGVALSHGIRRSGHRRAIILVQDDIRLAVALDKGDGVPVDGPLGCDHQIFRRHGAGDCLIPASEGVALSGGIRRSSDHCTIVLRLNDVRLAIALDKGNGVLVYRPDRGKGHITGRHGHAIGIAGPSGEGVAFLGRFCGQFDDRAVLVSHHGLGAIHIPGHIIAVDGPGCSIAPVSGGALCHRDFLGRLRQLSTGPSGEGVALTHRLRQGKAVSLHGVLDTGAGALGPAAASQIIGNVVGVTQSPLGHKGSIGSDIHIGRDRCTVVEPAVEGVALPDGGRQAIGLTIGHSQGLRLHSAASGIQGHGVLVGGPLGGDGHIPGGYRHTLGVAGPAIEAVSRLFRDFRHYDDVTVIQGLDDVILPVAQNEGNLVLVDGPLGGNGHILRGHVGGDLRVPTGEGVAFSGGFCGLCHHCVVILGNGNVLLTVTQHEGDGVLVNGPLGLQVQASGGHGQGEFHLGIPVVPASEGIAGLFRHCRLGDLSAVFLGHRLYRSTTVAVEGDIEFLNIPYSGKGHIPGRHSHALGIAGPTDEGMAFLDRIHRLHDGLTVLIRFRSGLAVHVPGHIIAVDLPGSLEDQVLLAHGHAVSVAGPASEGVALLDRIRRLDNDFLIIIGNRSSFAVHIPNSVMGPVAEGQHIGGTKFHTFRGLGIDHDGQISAVQNADGNLTVMLQPEVELAVGQSVRFSGDLRNIDRHKRHADHQIKLIQRIHTGTIGCQQHTIVCLTLNCWEMDGPDIPVIQQCGQEGCCQEVTRLAVGILDPDLHIIGLRINIQRCRNLTIQDQMVIDPIQSFLSFNGVLQFKQRDLPDLCFQSIPVGSIGLLAALILGQLFAVHLHQVKVCPCLLQNFPIRTAIFRIHKIRGMDGHQQVQIAGPVGHHRHILFQGDGECHRSSIGVEPAVETITGPGRIGQSVHLSQVILCNGIDCNAACHIEDHTVLVDGPQCGQGKIFRRHRCGNCDIPTGEGIALADRIGRCRHRSIVVLRHRIDHRITGTHEGDGVLIDGPQRGQGNIFSGHGCGNRRRPSGKGIARLDGIRRCRHRSAVLLGNGCDHRASGISKGNGIAVNRPVRVELQIFSHGHRIDDRSGQLCIQIPAFKGMALSLRLQHIGRQYRAQILPGQGFHSITAIGMESDRVGIDLPVRFKLQVSGGTLFNRQIQDLLGTTIDSPSDKGVAGLDGIVQREAVVIHMVSHRILDLDTAAIQRVGNGVGIPFPYGIQGDLTLAYQIGHFCAIVIASSCSIRSQRPAQESIALAGIGVGLQCFRAVIPGQDLGHLFTGTTVGMEDHCVVIGFPVGRVLPVSGRTLLNSHLNHRLSLAIPGPAQEGVAHLCGIVQGKAVLLHRVADGVCSSHGTACQSITDLIGIQFPNCVQGDRTLAD